MATEKQIEANRRNALASTGPRTPDGKARTRWNSYRHGLAGSGALLAPDEAYELQTRINIWRDKFGGRDSDPILLKQLAIESIKLERAQALTQAYLGDMVDQSQRAWAAKRREEIDRFASELSTNPSRIGAKLCTTAYGCEWLMTRWIGLLDAIEANGVWSATQCSLALDLIGLPHEFREGKTVIDPPTPEISERDHRAGIARQEVERFRAAMKGLMEYEDEERSRFSLGLIWETDATLERLSRYEAQSRRMFKWAYAKLEKDLDARERRAREHRATLADALAEDDWTSDEEAEYREQQFRELSGSAVVADLQSAVPLTDIAQKQAPALSAGQLGAMPLGFDGDPDIEERIEHAMREVKRRQDLTNPSAVANTTPFGDVLPEKSRNEPNFEHESIPERTDLDVVPMRRRL